MFHDKNHLQDKDNRKECENKVRDRLMDEKVRKSMDKNEALFCIGYYLPDIKIKANFTKPVYFSGAVLGQIDLSRTIFEREAFFNKVVFNGRNRFQ
jgi:hypothetical protein